MLLRHCEEFFEGKFRALGKMCFLRKLSKGEVYAYYCNCDCDCTCDCMYA